MSDIPDELEGFVGDISARLSEEISENLRDELISEVVSELPPNLAQAVQKGGLESLQPQKGVQKFMKKKNREVATSAVKQYSSKADHVERYMTQILEIDDLNNLSPREAEEFSEWRQYESLDREKPLAEKTLKDDMHFYIEFLEYMSKIQAVSPDVPNAVELPTTSEGAGVEKEMLEPYRAGDITDYLGQFRYASLDHIIWLLLTKTGRRPCDLRALDAEDHDSTGGEATLEFVHRPDTDTRLKEGQAHEAEISIKSRTNEAIKAFLSNVHPDTVDDYGRKPLLATQNGRIAKSTIREYVYRWTRPCKIGKECPYGKNEQSCDAASSYKKAAKCEGAKSPRKVRSGYVTAKLNSGASYGAVGHRVGATEEVLKRHYDHPNKDKERKRYENEIMSCEEDPESGYTHE